MPTRRQVIWASLTGAGALAIGVGYAPARRIASEYSPARAVGASGDAPRFIEIGPDNSIVAVNMLTEMGQGIATVLAQIVAEELDAPFERVSVRMAPSWRAYGQPVTFYTGGSTSAQRLYNDYRTVAATARALLIAAAAQRWDVPETDCRVEDASVLHDQSGRRLSFGELAAEAAKLTPPQNITPKPRSAWRVLGQPKPNVYAADIATGAARYGMDLIVPNMLVASIAQAPLEGATLEKLDREAAMASPGVIDVVATGDSVAVVAKHFWQANQALKRAGIVWRHAAESTDALREQLQAAVADVAIAPKPSSATQRVAALYEAPFLTHAQMEPLNATAHVRRLSAEIWTPTQVQEAMQYQVARALALWTHAVTIHTPFVGGGFGRRLRADYGVAAARIAKQLGKPVKVVWSREEDTAQGRFRPMAAAQLAAELDGAGAISRFSAHIASIGDNRRTHGIESLPYAVGANDTRFTGVPSSIRTGPWRSVDASQNVFFRESFIDECAHAARIDPLRYRRLLLSHDSRALRVLNALREMTDWDAARANNRKLGLAFDVGFGSLTAQAAEVTLQPDGVWRVSQVWAAVDCGVALNPNGIRAQLESGILYGLSAALFEAISYRNGRIEQRNYNDYRLLRCNEAPNIDLQILETDGVEIGGMGEVGVPPIAPAVANALFVATGTRARRLPLVGSGLPLYSR